VLLKVGDELTGSDLPDAHLALHAARADEFAALGQADRCDSSFMGVVDLPQELAVVDSVGSDLAVGPATNNDLVSENGAEWVDTALTWSVLGGARDASRRDGVRVRVPESHSSILTASDEFVRDAWHEPNAEDGLRVVLAQKHLREVLVPQAIDVAFLRRDQALQTICAR
jgi:hypothetical protein